MMDQCAGQGKKIFRTGRACCKPWRHRKYLIASAFVPTTSRSKSRNASVSRKTGAMIALHVKIVCHRLET